MNLLAEQLTNAANTHPVVSIRTLILDVLLPNIALIAGLDVLLKLAAGVSLAFGALTVLGGLLALTVSLFYLLLLLHLGEMVVGLYGLLSICALVFMLTRAGRAWGLDTVLASVKDRALFW